MHAVTQPVGYSLDDVSSPLARRLRVSSIQVAIDLLRQQRRDMLGMLEALDLVNMYEVTDIYSDGITDLQLQAQRLGDGASVHVVEAA